MVFCRELERLIDASLSQTFYGGYHTRMNGSKGGGTTSTIWKLGLNRLEFLTRGNWKIDRGGFS